MKNLTMSLLVLAVAVVFAAPAIAAETVTLEGEVICAKCTLGEDLQKCQNVLKVTDGEKTTHYYMTSTEANKDFGDVCMVAKEVKVTGTLSEKDGKTWIAATEIVPMKKEG